MKTIVLASAKGGVGKTTLAAHLAVGLPNAVIIDTDPQSSLTDWWNARTADTPSLAAPQADLRNQLIELDRVGFDFVIIDTPPTATDSLAKIVTVADYALVPVKPSPHDLRAVGRSVSLLETAGTPFAFVVTMAKPNARLTAQAAAELSQYAEVCPAFIGDRVEFAASMIDGQTVGEVSPRSPSTSEVSSLLTFVLARLTNYTKSRKR